MESTKIKPKISPGGWFGIVLFIVVVVAVSVTIPVLFHYKVLPVKSADSTQSIPTSGTPDTGVTGGKHNTGVTNIPKFVKHENRYCQGDGTSMGIIYEQEALDACAKDPLCFAVQKSPGDDYEKLPKSVQDKIDNHCFNEGYADGTVWIKEYGK